MRERSWWRGRGRAGGGEAQANSTSFAWPACSKWACNLRIATTLFDDIYEKSAMRARDGWEYGDSRAKVAREIEIRQVTENLDAIKCMEWSMTVALIFVMRAEGVSVTIAA